MEDGTMLRFGWLVLMALGTTGVIAQESEVSVERGALVAIIGGCHDCHTAGYAANNGQLDPEKALKGDTVGFQGPWGTTYPANLRLEAAEKSEDEWVDYLKTLETRPPMPWFNVRQFAETDMRSLHQYIKSLGEAGEPVPEFVPPGETPTTPYIVFAPPQMP
jgi:mono/diheme cytochrome c family protein